VSTNPPVRTTTELATNAVAVRTDLIAFTEPPQVAASATLGSREHNVWSGRTCGGRRRRFDQGHETTGRG
jgi:hypothetical protein